LGKILRALCRKFRPM